VSEARRDRIERLARRRHFERHGSIGARAGTGSSERGGDGEAFVSEGNGDGDAADEAAARHL
jgi:hypothetical protein